MDPMTPAPDDSERPEADQEAAGPSGGEEAGAPRGASDEEQTAADGRDPEVPSGSETDTWRGPETTGWKPPSIADAAGSSPGATSSSSGATGSTGPESNDATLHDAQSAPSSTPTADWHGPETSGWTPPGPETSGWTPPAAPASSDAPAQSGTPTADWHGPETSGWTPPAAPASSDAPAQSGTPTADWHGPETSGWTPDDARLAPPDQRPVERHPEWPASDRVVPPPEDIDDSGDARPADLEPPRRERVPAALSFFSRARPDHADSEDDTDSEAGYAPSEHLRVEERPRRLPGRRAAPVAVVRADPAEICPFLVAASGGWRLAVPSREHRCGAVNPPSPLSPQKQTRLCLTEGHLRCATFLAAGAARESRVGSAAMPERVSRWALARTTPVVEEVGGVRTTLAGMLADRRRWPAIPAMLLVVALATLGLSSLRGGGPVTALASPSPQPTEVVQPTVSIAPTPSVVPTAEPSPTAAPSPSPSPTPAPTPAPSHATYTVQSGDTLGAIAKQYGTTVQALVDLNGITDPGRLKIGQVLLLP